MNENQDSHNMSVEQLNELTSHFVFPYIQAFGPVTFKSILLNCVEQCYFCTLDDYWILSEIITKLMRDGKVALYDTGDSFVSVPIYK